MVSFEPSAIPRFKSSIYLKIIALDRLLLISECHRYIISDFSIVQIAPLINGKHTAANIIDILHPILPAHHVVLALQALMDAGHINMQNILTTPSEEAYWELLGSNAQDAISHLNSRSVAVIAIGGLNTERLINAFSQAKISISEGARLKIILTDDYLRPELLAIAQEAAEADAPLLLVKPVGITPTIGPLIHKQFGSCLTCLQHWIRHNHPVENLISRLNNSVACHLPVAQSASGEMAVYGMLAASVANLLALQEDRIPLKNHVLAIDLQRMESNRHMIQQRPQCSVCGDPQIMTRQASHYPKLQSVVNLFSKDGGYRKINPIQTVEKYQHLVSPVTGPIAYLHPMPNRHTGMRKVYVAGYLVCPQEVPHNNCFDKTCAGKGQTDEQARASALCEALERYSGVYQGDESRIRSSLNSLLAKGFSAVDFNTLQHFSEVQYLERNTINQQSRDRRRQVPERYLPDNEIDWTIAWSILTKNKIYIPLTYCYSEAPIASGSAFGIHNPNGAAAGNCLEEAILQGFLELVERDATAIWWYNQVARPVIDLTSFNDPYFDRLVQDYSGMGWKLWVLDLTHDLGIATCAALAFQPEENRYAIGFGCHLNAHLAVQRALTEVNQLFDPSDTTPDPWDKEIMKQVEFLFGNGEMRIAKEMPSHGGIDLYADVLWCAERCAQHGMDMLVLDKTRPDIGLSVVQVVVPGLRHFWPRFGAGRLYSVPVAMGWQQKATDEINLNPAPLFL